MRLQVKCAPLKDVQVKGAHLSGRTIDGRSAAGAASEVLAQARRCSYACLTN